MFGDRLKQARTNAKMTQQELAERIGAKGNSISNWEKGVSRPDIEQVSQICAVLNVSANYLIDTSEMSVMVSPHDKIILNKYHLLDLYGQELIDKALDIEYRRCTTQKPNIVPMNIASRSFNDEHKQEVIEDDVNDYINAPENDIDM